MRVNVLIVVQYQDSCPVEPLSLVDAYKSFAGIIPYIQLSILKMEETVSSNTVTPAYQTTWCHILESMT
jgi:hypothetical protein